MSLFSEVRGSFMFEELDAVRLNELLQNPQSVMLIDVRTPAEVARGAIPGARSIPLHMLPLSLSELEGEKPLVFYCQSGARSQQACNFVAARGRKGVYNLRGGIIGWLQSGLPTAQVA